MAPRAKKRVAPSADIETQVLVASRRRCCLCYFLKNIRGEQKGQIAHLDRDPSNSSFPNLVYLCFNHHDEFDSKTSQSKGLTVGEIREYRSLLYRKLGTTNIPSPTPEHAKIQKLILDFTTEEQLHRDDSDNMPLLHKPWRINYPAEEKPLLFAYKSPNRFDGICRIEQINLPDERTVVICEQIDENPGISITNAVEYIAEQICAQLNIDPQKLVMIQHYDTWYSYEKEWSLVTFKKIPPEGMFEEPQWIPMAGEDWRSLGFHPRRRSRKYRKEPSSLIRWDSVKQS
jgi:hypothetical protein